jgi:hypothetical protein
MRRPMTKAVPLIDEERQADARHASLDELLDPHHVLGDALTTPGHHRQLARQDLDTAVRGLVFELHRHQHRPIGVADHQVGAASPTSTSKQRIVVESPVR